MRGMYTQRGQSLILYRLHFLAPLTPITTAKNKSTHTSANIGSNTTFSIVLIQAPSSTRGNSVADIIPFPCCSSFIG